MPRLIRMHLLEEERVTRRGTWVKGLGRRTVREREYYVNCTLSLTATVLRNLSHRGRFSCAPSGHLELPK